MGNYLSEHNKKGLRKEAVFRCGKTGGTQSTPTVLGVADVLMFDRINEDKFELPIPELKSEDIDEFGGGPSGNGEVYLGYEVVEKDFPMDLQTAMFLMYGLGACTTTGTQIPNAEDTIASGQGTTSIVLTNTALSFKKNALAGLSIIIDPTPGTPSYHTIVSHAATTTAALTLVITPAAGASANTKKVHFMGTAAGTDVVAAGQNTASITLTNLCTVAANGLIGKTVIINSIKYVIIANAAKTGAALTLTLDKACGASDNTKTLTWYTYPYTHAITEANSLYSFIFHDELKDTSPSATFDILREYYGCLVKKVVIHLEPKQKVTCTATVMVGAYQQATTSGANVNTQTTFPEPFDDTQSEIFTFDMLDNNSTYSYFKYNGTSIESSVTFWNEVGAIDITIEREISYENVNGDVFPYKVKFKKRTYSVKFSGYTPTNNTLYLLRNKKLTEYTGPITLKFRLSKDKTRNDEYIDLTFDSLKLKSYPDNMVNIKEAQKAIDFELVNAMKYTDTTNVAHAVGTCVISALDKFDKRYYEDLA